MTEQLSATLAHERRTQVLLAARWCFLHFGFAKTSMEDIAKRAHLSRTLLYRMFKNKEDIFRSMFEDMFRDRYPAAEQIAASRGSRVERLTRACELLLLEPWAEMIGAPMAAEFYEVCSRIAPAAEAKHQKALLGVVQQILGSKEDAEVFLLSLDGLHGDLPSPRVLRRRVDILIARFCA
jgi:AcrR family transcriptional regulator